MSRAGDGVAAIAELALWVTAAALIASAAGMRLPGGLLASPTPTPTPTAVAAPSGSPGVTVSPAPRPSSTPGT